MKLTSIFSVLFLGTFAIISSAKADDTVLFTINGKILPRTCSVKAPPDQVITMKDKYVDDFPTIGKQVYGEVDGSFVINCPKTRYIDMTLRDAGDSTNTTGYILKNIAASEKAENVGVAVGLSHSGGGPFFFPLNQKRNFKAAETATAASDHYNAPDLEVTVKPYYYSTASYVSPGNVQAKLAIDISYR